jgi:chemotaxis protein methyltransferase CheR
MTAAPEDRAFQAILDEVRSVTGADFSQYAASTLRRRLAVAAAEVGAGDLAGLHAALARNPSRVPDLVAHICVSVTALFRDPSFHRTFRERALPLLRDAAPLRIWHAGCATGEEVWSMAILLEEAGLGARSRLYGTDIVPRVLEVAQSGILPLDRMREYTHNYHRAGGREDFSRYYAADASAALIRSFLRRRVAFARHDLGMDAPLGRFEAVVCRNVLIYFDAGLKERAYRLLHESLREGGVLALGHGEDLGDALRPKYEVLDARERIFRRIR